MEYIDIYFCHVKCTIELDTSDRGGGGGGGEAEACSLGKLDALRLFLRPLLDQTVFLLV